MTPEEQNLISSLFDRLGQASNQPKDAEADQLIGGSLLRFLRLPTCWCKALSSCSKLSRTRKAGLPRSKNKLPKPRQGPALSNPAVAFSPESPVCSEVAHLVRSRSSATPPPTPPRPRACNATTATSGLRVPASGAQRRRGRIFARRFNDRRRGRRRSFVVSRDRKPDWS